MRLHKLASLWQCTAALPNISAQLGWEPGLGETKTGPLHYHCCWVEQEVGKQILQEGGELVVGGDGPAGCFKEGLATFGIGSANSENEMSVFRVQSATLSGQEVCKGFSQHAWAHCLEG